MVVDIHKIITGNPITKNLMKPWGVNAKKGSIRSKMFGNYVDPGNCFHECKHGLNQVDLDPNTEEIIKINDIPTSENQWNGLKHDHKYYLAEKFGVDKADIKKKKLEADKEFLKKFKVRIPFDVAAYSAIKSKKVLGLGVENQNKILSEKLHKPKRKNYPRRKIIVNHIDEIFAADLVEMQKFAKMNKGYRYLLTCIDIFSKFAWVIPLKDKKGINVKKALEKVFKQRKCKFLFTDCVLEFYNKQVQDLLKGNNIKSYSTNNSEIKSSAIERFNRTFKNMMYKKFTENNNTIFYNNLDE